jgi:hypothetical protein
MLDDLRICLGGRPVIPGGGCWLLLAAGPNRKWIRKDITSCFLILSYVEASKVCFLLLRRLVIFKPFVPQNG